MGDTRRRTGQGIGRALRAAWATAPGLTAAATAIGIATALLPTVFTVATAQLVGALPAAIHHRGHRNQVDNLFAVAASSYVLLQLLASIREPVSRRLGRRLNAALQRRTLQACARPPHLDTLDEPETRAAVSLVRDNAGGWGLPGDAIADLFAVAPMKLAGVGGVVVLARYSLPVAAAALVLYVTTTAGMYRALELLAGADADGRGRFLPAEYLHDLLLRAATGREVRVFGLAPWLTSRMSASRREAMRGLWRLRGRIMTRIGWSLTVGGGIASAVLFAWLGLRAAHHEISLATFLTMFGAWQVAVQSQVSGEELRAMHGGAAMTALVELEQRTEPRPDSTQPGTPSPPRAALPRTAPGTVIELTDVRFRHAGADHEALAGVSLRIPAGQRIAVVGRNGAGKTTLATVLAGLRQPTSGTVAVDGTDLADVPPARWQRQVATLAQEFTHYPLSAFDNIALGAVELAEDREAVERAARLAGADRVLAEIGYETSLDATMTGGRDLSGGQWQRVGLARALLAVAAGARVLILDEPTAALDARAEAALFSELVSMPVLAGVTVVLVSHRFNSVRQADRIVVLSAGRVVEDGSHAELVARGGEYATLFRQQADLYVAAPGA